jgi:hypothetical protein
MFKAIKRLLLNLANKYCSEEPDEELPDPLFAASGGFSFDASVPPETRTGDIVSMALLMVSQKVCVNADAEGLSGHVPREQMRIFANFHVMVTSVGEDADPILIDPGEVRAVVDAMLELSIKSDEKIAEDDGVVNLAEARNRLRRETE